MSIRSVIVDNVFKAADILRETPIARSMEDRAYRACRAVGKASEGFRSRFLNGIWAYSSKKGKRQWPLKK